MSDPDVEALANEGERLLEKWSDRVTVRGAYDTTAFASGAGLLMWWVASRAVYFVGTTGDGFVALARSPEDVRWGPSAWIYVAVLALSMVVGGYGLLRARRAAH